jgi:hypothetical protein
MKKGRTEGRFPNSVFSSQEKEERERERKQGKR